MRHEQAPTAIVVDQRLTGGIRRVIGSGSAKVTATGTGTETGSENGMGIGTGTGTMIGTGIDAGGSRETPRPAVDDAAVEGTVGDRQAC